MDTSIKIIYPASKANEPTPKNSILELKKCGFECQELDAAADSPWDFLSGTVESRTQQLVSLLRNPKDSVIIAGRGGFGASDLLPHMNWEQLHELQETLLIGFSDISSLQSAFYTKLNWRSIHGPMPNTEYWKDVGQDDIKMLLDLLRFEGKSIHVPLDQSWGKQEATGILFGGCLSVLTGLIGTPYIPQSLAEHILFFEDIGEHPARILRFINQWQQSGMLEGVRHIVFGDLSGLEELGYDKSTLCNEIHERTQIPVSSSKYFGHCSPNYPLGIGYKANISSNELIWKGPEYDHKS